MTSFDSDSKKVYSVNIDAGQTPSRTQIRGERTVVVSSRCVVINWERCSSLVRCPEVVRETVANTVPSTCQDKSASHVIVEISQPIDSIIVHPRSTCCEPGNVTLRQQNIVHCDGQDRVVCQLTVVR